MKKYDYETVVKMTFAALLALAAIIYYSSVNAPKQTHIQISAQVEVIIPTPEPEDPNMDALAAYDVALPDRICFYKTINGEARNQKRSGQVKVGEVILNRLDHGHWGDTICEVVQYVNDGVYHFTTWDPKDPNRAHIDKAFDSDVFTVDTLESISVGMEVLEKGVRYLPRDSYNYATFRINNYWTRKLEFVEQDGDHIFRKGF